MTGVPELATGEPGLVQLQYATGKLDDSWRMMVCCILLNQTTRAQLDKVRGEVFERWPQAHAMAEADWVELYGVIRPCGFGEIRANRLIRFSRDWMDFEVVKHEAPDFRLPTAAEVRAMHGIGKYAEDSYRMFALGEWKTVDPQDKELLRWWYWRMDRERAA